MFALTWRCFSCPKGELRKLRPVACSYRQLMSANETTDSASLHQAGENSKRLSREEIVRKKIETIEKTTKIRSHVNPLSRFYTHKVEYKPSDWENVFADKSLPLHIDIGCGTGRYVRSLAQSQGPGWYFLGMEIRHALVHVAQEKAQSQQCSSRLHFVADNALVNLGSLLASLPVEPRAFSFMFSDPWWKVRHKKRRTISPQVLDSIASAIGKLPPCSTATNDGAVTTESNTISVSGLLLVRSDQSVVVKQADDSMAECTSNQHWRQVKLDGELVRAIEEGHENAKEIAERNYRMTSALDYDEDPQENKFVQVTPTGVVDARVGSVEVPFLHSAGVRLGEGVLRDHLVQMLKAPTERLVRSAKQGRPIFTRVWCRVGESGSHESR
eukprot:comp6889_c0_seq1/m.2638 comp6889_c0_seq1/g.2638  ORF comp6889_c0_seq1/g.2638 comp6889_c0_seq1/m.2638 type:complete len:385 (-) comp6889_c0_seq1:75-1229(-)